jgi:hypothetical protein
LPLVSGFGLRVSGTVVRGIDPLRRHGKDTTGSKPETGAMAASKPETRNRGNGEMLTSDLLRFRIDNGACRPLLLKPTPTTAQLVDDLLAHWRGGIGKLLGELEDAATPILHRSRALVVARGMMKLITDGCTFTDPTDASTLRARVFAAALPRLGQGCDPEAHRAAVAAALGEDAATLGDRLYADLPDRAVLASAPDGDAETWIARYNLALCQGLLLSATGIEAEVRDADTGLRRKLLAALRFRRLLADARIDDSALHLSVAGPASVLEQSARYGMQLAQWLPALCCAKVWRATVHLRLPRRHGGSEAALHLDSGLGLPGTAHALGFVPEDVRAGRDRLASQLAPWRIEEPTLLPLPGGELAAPDLRVVTERGEVHVELFHRWHHRPLARRLEQLAAQRLPLVLGVDRALAKREAAVPLLTGAVFDRHGFLFSEVPIARAVRDAVERVLGV